MLKGNVMQNPWEDLQEKPTDGEYVLSQDKPYIDAFNHWLSGKCLKAKKRVYDDVSQHPHWINLRHTPEPRLGPVDAKVFILQANPSCPVGVRKDFLSAGDRKLVRDIKDQYSFHKARDKNTAWWSTRLLMLREAVGNAEQFGRNLCSVEYFPYRSNQWGHSHIRLPSQSYCFEIVRRAASSGRVIIVNRLYREWIGAVPELSQAKYLYRLNSQQSAYVTPGNLPKGAYDVIVDALCS